LTRRKDGKILVVAILASWALIFFGRGSSFFVLMVVIHIHTGPFAILFVEGTDVGARAEAHDFGEVVLLVAGEGDRGLGLEEGMRNEETRGTLCVCYVCMCVCVCVCL
jgi:hypothetical protein